MHYWLHCAVLYEVYLRIHGKQPSSREVTLNRKTVCIFYGTVYKPWISPYLRTGCGLDCPFIWPVTWRCHYLGMACGLEMSLPGYGMCPEDDTTWVWHVAWRCPYLGMACVLMMSLPGHGLCPDDVPTWACHVSWRCPYLGMACVLKMSLPRHGMQPGDVHGMWREDVPTFLPEHGMWSEDVPTWAWVWSVVWR